MVALNKTYRETLTPDRSAKDSGLRYYSPEISRWLSRDPIGEDGGGNLYVFVFNTPTILFDLYGLITGPDTIIALDKTYPTSQFDTYSSSDVCCWEVDGVLAFVPGQTLNSDSVSVYPTTDSTSTDDSKVIAHKAGQDEVAHVTVIRPKMARRGPRLSLDVNENTGLFVSTWLTYRWYIKDQFGHPLVGVLVQEDVSTLFASGVIGGYGNYIVLGSQVTTSDGSVKDKVGASFISYAGSWSAIQTLIIGNWTANSLNTLGALGHFDAPSSVIFN
jgi:RHS repeat-associated protein